MYSLDVNFLKDRPELNPEKKARSPKTRFKSDDVTPLYLGLGVGLLLPALVGLGLLILQYQNSQLDQEIAARDAELSQLGIQEQEIAKNKQQTVQTKASTQALATVFNQIRPWSAMLQDIRDRIPATVQIETIKQAKQTPTIAAKPTNQTAPNQPAAQPAPPPAATIEINGLARSFSDVNDFLLTLQQSTFLKSPDTKIVSAELIKPPATTLSNQGGVVVVQPPEVVRYTIQSSVSDIPASELLRELERKGTVGLVTRIRTLQQKGVINNDAK